MSLLAELEKPAGIRAIDTGSTELESNYVLSSWRLLHDFRRSSVVRQEPSMILGTKR
jgi:hypothetical protein